MLNEPRAQRRRSLIRSIGAVFATAALALTAVVLPSSAASATGPYVVINGGGGKGGGTGVKLELNKPYGSSEAMEQIWLDNQPQYFEASSGFVSPYLNVGGQAFGNISYYASVWTSEVLAMSGSASSDSSSTSTGSGSVTLRYTATRGGLNYTVDRHITYTYPNNFFTENYTFVIPDGNTEMVKFYAGGDAFPGGSDSGYGIMLTTPVRSVISLNPVSQVQVGYREQPGGRPFDGATAISYSLPYAAVQSGGDIGFQANPSTHDAGIMMQWTLGATPGTYTGGFQTFAGEQAATLTADFSSTTSTPGAPVILSLSVENTLLTAAGGLGYRFTLPSGLVIGTGATTNTCGSTTFTAVPGSNEIILAGGSVPAASNCVAQVPVVAAASGTYTITSASASDLAALANGVGTVSLLVGVAPTAPVALPTLVVGTVVDTNLDFGGSPAPTHAVTTGALPAGLTLDTATGKISGTPTTPGAYDFTVTATNAIGSYAQNFVGTVMAAPTWATQVLPSMQTGTRISVPLAATGTPAPTYALTSGTLPAGLSIVNGKIDGTPTTAGAYDFTVTATNQAGSAPMRFTGAITAPAAKSNDLASTGSDSSTVGTAIVISGIGLLAGGLVLLTLRRKANRTRA